MKKQEIRCVHYPNGIYAHNGRTGLKGRTGSSLHKSKDVAVADVVKKAGLKPGEYYIVDVALDERKWE